MIEYSLFVFIKRLSSISLACSFSLAAAYSVSAQLGSVKNAAGPPLTSEAKTSTSTEKATDGDDARTPAQLFEEADKYAQKKFDDFEKRHMPFDARLSDKIKQEQREL